MLFRSQALAVRARHTQCDQEREGWSREDSQGVVQPQSLWASRSAIRSQRSPRRQSYDASFELSSNLKRSLFVFVSVSSVAFCSKRLHQDSEQPRTSVTVPQTSRDFFLSSWHSLFDSRGLNSMESRMKLTALFLAIVAEIGRAHV